MTRRFLVTGGSGFIGSALVLRLLRDGHHVRILDNNSRGAARRLAAAASDIEWVAGDIRDAAAVSAAVKGVDAVHHLAYVNGTQNFYDHPDLVMEVAAKGMINVVDACIAHDVGDLILASSSEVYQTPPQIPTGEAVPLVVPDLMNPRFSYGGGKIFAELYAIHVAQRHLRRIVIFRPHNVYGPDMGWDHVIPQFAMRMQNLARPKAGPADFPIQGTGEETRSFCYIDDFVDGLILLQEKSTGCELYNIGTQEEVTISQLAHKVAGKLGVAIRIISGELASGSTLRRCPSIDRIKALGYVPRVLLDDGLGPTCQWYVEHRDLFPTTKL